MQKIFSALFSFTLFLNIAYAGSEVPTEVTNSTASLTVTISAVKNQGKRIIFLAHQFAHFHVLVKNTSTQDIKLWKNQNSWGYYALTFEVFDTHGKQHIVRKKAIAFKKNSPVSFTLGPGETEVIDVYFQSGTWEGVPYSDSSEPTLTRMRAIYQIEPTKESSQHGIWTGRAFSPTSEYVIDNQRN